MPRDSPQIEKKVVSTVNFFLCRAILNIVIESFSNITWQKCRGLLFWPTVHCMTPFSFLLCLCVWL